MKLNTPTTIEKPTTTTNHSKTSQWLTSPTVAAVRAICSPTPRSTSTARLSVSEARAATEQDPTALVEEVRALTLFPSHGRPERGIFSRLTCDFQGAANIADSSSAVQERGDKDLVPDAAVRQSIDSNHHVGRGGAGNAKHVNPKAIDHDKRAAEEYKTSGKSARGLADKLKDMMTGKNKK